MLFALIAFIALGCTDVRHKDANKKDSSRVLLIVANKGGKFDGVMIEPLNEKDKELASFLFGKNGLTFFANEKNSVYLEMGVGDEVEALQTSSFSMRYTSKISGNGYRISIKDLKLKDDEGNWCEVNPNDIRVSLVTEGGLVLIGESESKTCYLIRAEKVGHFVTRSR